MGQTENPKQVDPPHWKQLRAETLQDCRVFKVGEMEVESPRTGAVHTFYRIDSTDWINIVPVTANDEIVMVRQFRHGSREVTLELPGGMVDPGEDPVEAAARELLEETGYRATRVDSLGVVNPNPALFGNRCHSFLARDVAWERDIENDSTEETVVELVPRRKLRARLQAGDIDHALVVAALLWFELHDRGSVSIR